MRPTPDPTGEAEEGAGPPPGEAEGRAQPKEQAELETEEAGRSEDQEA